MEEKILDFLRKKVLRPVSIREILVNFKLSSKERPLIKNEMRKLVKQGAVVKLQRGRYGIPEKMSLLTGIYQAHPDGFGFVLSEEGKDVFVGSKKTSGAMDSDLVVVRIESGDDKPSGRIIQILERAHNEIVGRFEKEGKCGFVIPMNPRLTHDVFIPRESKTKAKNGDIVTVKIVEYPQNKRNPIGETIEVLGRSGDPDLDLKVVIKNHNLPDRFSSESIEEAKKHSKKAITLATEDKREDWREKIVFTIDGEDAKDFDDAVSIEKTDTGDLKLSVHIADVSNYVKPHSHIDKEAYERGTSVYFPGTVLPMIPFELSAGICSLKENEDRFCLAVEMIFSPAGERKSFRFFKSIIRSKKRLTYTLVQKILDGEIEDFPYTPDLVNMNSLAKLLKKKRLEQGGLDFDLPEPQFNTNAYGKILSIEKRERNEAHKLIEEFMLAANGAAAELMVYKKLPAFFRIHEVPDESKASELFEVLRLFGYKPKNTSFKNPKTLQKAVAFFEGKSEEHVVQILMLRSLKQARYSANNEGHFGLAMENYTHFTSPIRRYPDLYVHRIIKNYLDSKKSDLENIDIVAQHTSTRERAAEDAQKDFESVKRVEFMEDKIGNIYTGTISGVKSYGFFVELDKVFIEGLVRVGTLYDDYYHFVEKELTLVGEDTGKFFTLGMDVKVKVIKTDREKRHIDFRLI